MAQARFDLSDLTVVDLQALRLGAQVMSYKAGLVARPRVETFFLDLRLAVDQEIASRKRTPDDAPLVSPEALPVIGTGRASTAPTGDDRQLAAEYLDLLGSNSRLSQRVRETCRALREHLGRDL